VPEIRAELVRRDGEVGEYVAEQVVGQDAPEDVLHHAPKAVGLAVVGHVVGELVGEGALEHAIADEDAGGCQCGGELDVDEREGGDEGVAVVVVDVVIEQQVERPGDGVAGVLGHRHVDHIQARDFCAQQLGLIVRHQGVDVRGVEHRQALAGRDQRIAGGKRQGEHGQSRNQGETGRHGRVCIRPPWACQ
jgi:hypothetical protein